MSYRTKQPIDTLPSFVGLYDMGYAESVSMPSKGKETYFS